MAFAKPGKYSFPPSIVYKSQLLLFFCNLSHIHFLKYSQKNALVPIDFAGYAKSKKFIQLTLKAEIARQLWTEEGYYIIINELDKEMQTAILNLQKMKK